MFRELIRLIASAGQSLSDEARVLRIVRHHPSTEQQMMTSSIGEQPRGSACAQPFVGQAKGVTRGGAEQTADEGLLVHAANRFSV